MKPPAYQTLLLEDPEGLGQLVPALEGRFAPRPGGTETFTRAFWDSHDWRLWRKGLCLVLDHEGWRLWGGDLNEIRVPRGRGGRLPRRLLVRDLPPGPLADALVPLLGIRALLPLARARVRAQDVLVRNRDAKTVVRLTLENVVFEGLDRPLALVRLRGLRGYDREFARVRKILAGHGATSPLSLKDECLTGVRALGREPGDYDSGFSIELSADMDALTALARIYQELLGAMRANVDGVLADLDSEFLHDLRVAVRRTRSALGLTKGVLDPEVQERFAAEFAWIGRITGPVRDLDVYLLSRDDYTRRLPGLLHPGLEVFFEKLETRRGKELARMRRDLRGERFSAILEQWEALLQEPIPGPRASRPVRVLGARVIGKRLRRILRDGQAIGPDTPDEALHRLRIQGKKLRYALEFFASLFPRTETRAAIRQLKKLQNNLGDFNDLSVQQDMLAAHIGALRGGTAQVRGEAAALGGLVATLYHEQRAVRRKFEATFARFAAPENRELFARTFTPGQGGRP